MMATRIFLGRAPHGARGLKPGEDVWKNEITRSRPARGAWIETFLGSCKGGRFGSRPARGAWIETFLGSCKGGRFGSRPARGAWIETPKTARVDY